MEWLERIEPLDLVAKVPQVQLMNLNSHYTVDDVAALMVQGAPRFFAALKNEEKEALLKGKDTRSRQELPPKECWPQVKNEFHIFLCTDNPKYDDLRKKLDSSASATSTTIIGAIAAAIGSHLGFEAGALVGLVAVCLYGVLKIGKEVYCSAST